MGVGGYRHAPSFLTPGETQYPLYRRLGRPQGWSGWVRKICTPTHRGSNHGPSSKVSRGIRSIVKRFHIKKKVLKTTYISTANDLEFLYHELVSHCKPLFLDFFFGRGTLVYETFTGQKQIYSRERNSNSFKLPTREFICKAAYTVRTMKHSFCLSTKIWSFSRYSKLYLHFFAEHCLENAADDGSPHGHGVPYY